MAESLECGKSEKLDTDKSTTLVNEKTLEVGNNSDLSLSLEGSVVASPSIESFSTLPEAESSLTLCEDTPDLAVRVDNPQKHFDLFETYITFRVTTKTTRSEFETTDYCVRRRYNDFSWLRQHLVEEYPTHFVPPLPVKHSIIGQLDRYGRDFVTARMASLQTFLLRIVKHPILSCASCLKCFLTASNEEFLQVRKLTGSNVIAKKLTDSLSSLATLHIEPQRPPEMAKLSEYLAALSDKLSHICKISQRIHKERSENTAELLELKAIFQQWAGSETELTDPLCEVASAVDKVRQSLQNVVLDTENFILTQPLKEYLLYAEAVKEALGRRDNIEMNYRLLAEELEKKNQERDELLAEGNGYNLLTTWTKTAIETKGERLSRLDNIIPKYQQQVEEARDKLECANENVRADLDRWNIEKTNDLKSILISFADQQIAHYEQCIRAWNEVVIQNPGGSRPRSLSGVHNPCSTRPRSVADVHNPCGTRPKSVADVYSPCGTRPKSVADVHNPSSSRASSNEPGSNS